MAALDFPRIPRTPTFSLVVVGDAQVGKTAFVHRHRTGEFLSDYHPSTAPLRTVALEFYTNYGPIGFRISDIPSSLDAPLRRPLYENASCAIVMFDVQREVTYDHVEAWYEEVTRVAGPNIPIVLVGNKLDVEGARRVKPGDITFHRSRDRIQYYDISVKSNFNFSKPFIWLVRTLTGAANATLVQAPPGPRPPEISLDQTQIQAYEQELRAARDVVLPDEDDDW